MSILMVLPAIKEVSYACYGIFLEWVISLNIKTNGLDGSMPYIDD